MFENLNKEILEKIKQAKSKEEALNILKENGITLTDEDLAGVAGGDGANCYVDNPCTEDKDCPGNCIAYVPFCDIVCYTYETCPQHCGIDALCPLQKS